ncbi:hypothetical protein VTL71DRAFT_15895 [Oculimacula yallundae]|uniref:Uncharacterized protein n=1 Tax=Oculimacula yallundae TaxID=86028 RepID=A0ABR4CCZ3_9HELO
MEGEERKAFTTTVRSTRPAGTLVSHLAILPGLKLLGRGFAVVAHWHPRARACILILAMAIIEDGGNKYEVRIKRCDNGAYFDDRYIVGEDGVEYTIELRLHKGFDFGEFTEVQAKLHIPGRSEYVCHRNLHKTKIVKKPTTNEADPNVDDTDIESADLVDELKLREKVVPGVNMLGSNLTFRGLSIDEKLAKETDVMGVDVADVGYFKVTMCGRRWTTKKRSPAETRKARLAALKLEPVLAGPGKQNTWDASRVDVESFKNDGLEFGIGITGGILRAPAKIFNVKRTYTRGNIINFYFYYRSSERQKFIKYPAPLYCFAWSNLLEHERKTALSELQEINKEHVHRDREAKAGSILPKPGKRGKGSDYLPEWRNWSRLYVGEREATFNALKKANESWENGEDPTSLNAIEKSDLIIIDDSDEEDKKPAIKRERASHQVVEDVFEVAQSSEVEIKKKIVAENGQRDIEDEAPPVKRIKVTGGIENPAESVNDFHDDEQLGRDKVKAKQLADEIETEMRLAKLMRQQRDLTERIEAAEKKKNERK